MAFLSTLGNGRHLGDQINKVLEKVKLQSRTSFSIVLIDRNRFKQINDQQGHDVGDEVLVTVAKGLRGAVNDECVVTRQGGDEFMIIIPNVKGHGDVIPVVEQIQHQVTGQHCFGEYRLDIALGMGIAIYQMDGTDKESLMKHADIAMYQAKRLGDNEFVFFEQLKVRGK